MFSILQFSPPLVQVSQFAWKKSDPGSGYVFIGILVAIILFLIIAGRSDGASSGSPVYTGKTNRTRRFSHGGFRRRARSLGLSRFQIKTLENLYRQYNVPNPMVLLSGTGHMDALLRKAVMSIDAMSANESVRENQKLTLFRIRQLIEQNSQKKTIYSGTTQLKTGLAVALTPEDGGRYQSKIISVLKDSLAFSIPHGPSGQEARWKKGTRLKIFFWKSNGQGYSFFVKISGYANIRGIPCVLTGHSSSIVQAQQRKFRRKHIDKPAYYYPVRILTEGLGKNAKKRAFIDTSHHMLSTIIDVSAGGCSLRTGHPLSENELIKVEFETDRSTPVSFFGKVKHMRKVRPYGGVMHIMFTRISKRNLNRINSFVYDIVEN